MVLIEAANARIDAADDRTDDAEARLDVAEADLVAAQARLDDAEAELVAAEARIAAAETKVNDAKSRLDIIESKLSDAEASIKVLVDASAVEPKTGCGSAINSGSALFITFSLLLGASLVFIFRKKKINLSFINSLL